MTGVEKGRKVKEVADTDMCLPIENPLDHNNVAMAVTDYLALSILNMNQLPGTEKLLSHIRFAAS
jgi:hypothetical protein